MKRILLFVCASFIGLVVHSQVAGLPEGFFTTNATNTSDWSEPVGAVFSKDGLQLFVWDKAGIVYVNNRYDQGNGNSIYNKQLVPVIDIHEEVGNWSDMGLLGFALDPGFTTTNGGYIYLLYVVDRHYLKTGGDPDNGYNPIPANIDQQGATIGRITRYNTTVSGGILSADLNSREVLLGESITTGIPILHKSHSVGSLAFAADGTLLATTGDGASYDDTDVGAVTNADPNIHNNVFYIDALADGIITPKEDVGAFRSQMLSSLSGKLLRLNKENGNGMSSNPFFDPAAPRSAKSRVWALGFRNPFRMSVKPGAGSTNPTAGDIGEVFVGDVGFGLSEELNIVKSPGQNFGWPIYEGNGPSAEPNKSYWGYIYTKNRDELRPPCPADSRDTMYFHELIRQDNAAKNSEIYHTDCDGSVIRSGIRFIHARPALDWAHVDGDVFVSRFDADGNAVGYRVGSPESGVTTDTTTFKGNASTGGIWYTGAGNMFPPEFKDKFLVSDFGGRWIRRIGIEFSDVVTSVNNFFIIPAGNEGNRPDGAVVSMAENPIDGSLVYVCVGLPQYYSSSSVRKIVYGGNVPPVAKITADQYYSATSDLTVNFSGGESYDQNGTVVSYSWDFGDPTSADNTSTEKFPTHEFHNTSGAPKKYIVKLIVTDNEGVQSEEVTFIVSLNNVPPVVTIVEPGPGTKYKIGPDTTYTLRADVVDNPTQVLTYAWQTTLAHNNHFHPGPIDPAVETSAAISRIGCNGDTYSWLITLKVTDDAGLFDTTSVRLTPDCAAALPLMLRSFSVTQKTSVNLVQWTTELEANIEYFEVERSYDGVNFYAINRQEARNIAGTSNYSYPDNDITPGLIYYRLKIVEHGSIIRYSVIVRTMSEGEDLALKVVPNPIVENFSVIYNSQRDDIVTVEVRDIAGRLLHSLKEKVNRGQNVIYMQNLPNWPAGVYTVAIKNNDGIKQAKFVKAGKD
ncbi:PQQ-dependent sugar dehydrogenase [Terrimonas pollutisoli]|uniref:PQQ-dependent sugar dehydrogenase n=1 Tax=Terrimonas pollutisoli TaxID=3034147 RepID=UPI0023EC86DC|nr:PQQ-dependent sugar dehydrogenase [Terrimonas sp. H1YJ31]